MKRFRAAAFAFALTLIALSPSAPFKSFDQTLQAQGRLEQLRGMAELKSWFNGSNGRPRLIFLLSPT